MDEIKDKKFQTFEENTEGSLFLKKYWNESTGNPKTNHEGLVNQHRDEAERAAQRERAGDLATSDPMNRYQGSAYFSSGRHEKGRKGSVRESRQISFSDWRTQLGRPAE